MSHGGDTRRTAEGLSPLSHALARAPSAQLPTISRLAGLFCERHAPCERVPSMFARAFSVMRCCVGCGALAACVAASPIRAAAGEPESRAFSRPFLQAPSFNGFLARRNVPIALAGAAATWAALQAENAERQARLLEAAPAELGADVGDVYGDARVLGAASLALWLSGYAAGSSHLAQTGEDLSKSLVVSGVIVWTLKVAVDRTRPNGASFSFPSGHTAAAFSVAPIVARRFGWKAALPAYALATMTAIGRMEERRHYLSDVAFGATLGIIVGEAIAHRASDGGLPGHISIDGDGVGLTFDF